MTIQTDPDDDLVLEVTCVFDAPLDSVYEAWIKPEVMLEWFAPRGFTVRAVDMEPRPGGRWRVQMRSPEGTDQTEFGTVIQHIPSERLVLTHAWLQPDGKPGHATEIRVLFSREGDKTHMAFRQATFASKHSRDEHDHGWISAFQILAELLGVHASPGMLPPGSAHEMLQHARPMLEIVRARVLAPTSAVKVDEALTSDAHKR